MARAKRSGGEGSGAGGAGAPSEEPSFESALAALEGVVATLESGEMPLEQALVAFENGVKLSRQCAAKLDAAERRIEILSAERGGLRAVSFDDEDAADTDGDDGGEDADLLGDDSGA